MSDARITIEGEAIEVAGRFSSEAELDAFCERLWGIFFALHPAAVEEGAPAREAAPVELPQLPHSPSVMARLDPAIHESLAQRSAVNASEIRGSDVEKEEPASQPPTPDQTAAAPQAFAQLSPQERRAVMLMRKYKDRNKVAQEMEIGAGTVAVYLSTARKKGVSA